MDPRFLRLVYCGVGGVGYDGFRKLRRGRSKWSWLESASFRWVHRSGLLRGLRLRIKVRGRRTVVVELRGCNVLLEVEVGLGGEMVEKRPVAHCPLLERERKEHSVGLATPNETFSNRTDP